MVALMPSYQEWIELRLRDKLKKNSRTGCWVWTGPVNRGGYGYMSVAIPGRKRRKALVHRLAAWLWLDMEDVREIRVLSELRHMTGVGIADKMGVSTSTVSKILRGQTWPDA